MKKENRNEATRFIMPMLASEISFRKNDVFEPYNNLFFQRNTFINAYISDSNKPELENKIFIRYEYDYSLDFPIFERKLEQMLPYIDDYSYNNSIVYVFDVPEKWINDYEAFKQGKYSQLSKEYKTHVLDFWSQKSGSAMHWILNNKKENIKHYLKIKRNISLKDLNNPGELWFKPGEKEILS